MDLKEIGKVINNSMLDDDYKEIRIIEILSKDQNVIPTIMQILAAERSRKSKLLQDMNVQLSRAQVVIESPDLNINKDNFIVDEIDRFYIDNKDQIGHCFKDMSKVTRKPLPDEDKKWL